MTWQPVSHRIIVKPDPVVETTKGGIILATDKKLEQNAQVFGTIVAIGEDAWKAFNPFRPRAGLEVGDRVAYAKYAGKWISDDVLVLNDEDVVAKEIQDNDVDA